MFPPFWTESEQASHGEQWVEASAKTVSRASTRDQDCPRLLQKVRRMSHCHVVPSQTHTHPTHKTCLGVSSPPPPPPVSHQAASFRAFFPPSAAGFSRLFPMAFLTSLSRLFLPGECSYFPGESYYFHLSSINHDPRWHGGSS